VGAAGSEEIDGSTTLVEMDGDYDYVVLASDGTGWHRIGGVTTPFP